MAIYTKKGDKGKTSLFSGERILKSDLRVEAYGTVDELNAFIGLLVAWAPMDEKQLSDELRMIQSKLFIIGSWLAATPGSSMAERLPSLYQQDIEALEEAIDRMQASMPELKEFILPGGDQAAAAAHIVRTVCRRAERQVIRFLTESEIDLPQPYERLIAFINRLSDYMFMLARYLNHINGLSDASRLK